MRPTAQMRDFLEEYTTTVQTAYDYECRQDYVSEFEGNALDVPDAGRGAELHRWV